MSRFKEDSDYEPTDSDEDYNENEKILLEKVRKNRKTNNDSEEEVFGVGSNDDDDDDDDANHLEDDDSDHSDMALSDVEGQDQDDDLPDKRAWGKNKRAYYSTDYVDPDYGNVQGQQAQQAEMEEDEVNEWEKDLQQQLGDSDFFGITTTTTEKDETKSSKRNKLKLSLKDSKDFFLIVQSYDEITETATKMLAPVITKFRKGQIPNCPAMEFVTTFYEISINFCTNVCMYLVLKASQVDLKKHPVIKKLNQYRQLLDQLRPIYEEIIVPQIEILLQNNDENKTKLPKKKLKILNEISKKIDEKLTDKTKESLKQKVKIDTKPEIGAAVDKNDDNEEEEEMDNDINDGEPSKRPITYQMAKNKGLTPHRKKEQRNPRVKHRNKYRKAKIRRKGAVREPRTEMKRYSGEISGIKATVTKSIKIK